MRAAVRIGTSGWNYPHWKGRFYPRDLPQRQWLPHYAHHFDTVEINNTFYHLPSSETFTHWAQNTPGGFCFAVKASRHLTHLKKLKDSGEPLHRFIDHSAALGRRLGPTLFQLPPRWRTNPERLACFINHLPPHRPCAFEFRDPSWFNDAVYDILRAHDCAFCVHHLAGQQSPIVRTAPWIYLRLHGPDGPYQGRYGRERLTPWAERIHRWAQNGYPVYCYFDNDQNAYAIEDALILKELLAA